MIAPNTLGVGAARWHGGRLFPFFDGRGRRFDGFSTRSFGGFSMAFRRRNRGHAHAY